MINAFCNAVNPFADSRMIATADWATPHVNLTTLGGLSDPYVVCMPRTNVAESADVMKKMAMRMIAIIDSNIDIGSSLKMAKRVSSVNQSSQICSFYLYIHCGGPENREPEKTE